MYWLLVILALGLLIFVHELGHYLVARWCGMRVDKFSIGFGPAILKWKDKHGAQFQLSPILFGGYVAIAGMNVGDEIDPTDKTAYPNKPTWQRIAAIFAGPGFNYLFATVLALTLFLIAGQPAPKLLVGETDATFDAHGKLLPEDKLLSINGQAIDSVGVLTSAVQAAKDAPVSLVVERGGAPMTVQVRPKVVTEDGKTSYRIGIRMKPSRDREHVPFVDNLKASVAAPFAVISAQFMAFKDILTRKAEPELRGPVGMAHMMKQAAEQGWIDLVSLLIGLNAALAFINLLPLPALDGGRLAFLGYELVTRRRPNQKIEALVHMVGIMFFLVVFLVVTYQDCGRAFTGGN